MGISSATLGASRRYTKESLLGGGAIKGKDGKDGTNGKSAYEIAKANGFGGTEQEWLESLKGVDGVNGQDGTNGKDGIDGFSPTITENGNNSDDVYKLDITTKNSTFTTPNLKGKDGDGSSSVDLSDYAKKDDIPDTSNFVEKEEGKELFSGKYEDLTGTPTIPSTDGLATEIYVNTKIADLVNNAPETLDTLKEVADAIEHNESVVDALNESIGKKVDKVDGKDLSTNDFTDAIKESYDKAVADSHIHNNKVVLDSITSDKIAEWDNKLGKNENAISATQLQTIRTIDGVSFDGTGDVVHYGVCETAADVAEKTVNIPNLIIADGARILIKFVYANTNVSPTLNVNGLGAKNMYCYGTPISAGLYRTLKANYILEFVYINSRWEIVGTKDNINIEVVNNLTTSITGCALDANQGQVLNSKISNIGVTRSWTIDSTKCNGINFATGSATTESYYIKIGQLIVCSIKIVNATYTTSTDASIILPLTSLIDVRDIKILISNGLSSSTAKIESGTNKLTFKTPSTDYGAQTFEAYFTYMSTY